MSLALLAPDADAGGVVWELAGARVVLDEVNDLLERRHYLGPIRSGGRLIVTGRADGVLVAAQVWRFPTSRHLPFDGTWLELSRWVLTPEAGPNAGSRMHAAAVRAFRDVTPAPTTLVSYSDPSAGHTGALYRACNWLWAPTWHRLRPPPTGHGEWTAGKAQAVKDRWIFPVRRDRGRAGVVAVSDRAAVRSYLASDEWRTVTRRWRAAVDLERAAA